MILSSYIQLNTHIDMKAQVGFLAALTHAWARFLAMHAHCHRKHKTNLYRSDTMLCVEI